ncbi:MAG: phosphatidate cytidylyltransferase [Haliscomenobacter sp.]|nr:phosphatidate cytidylyltransferase [Haliscomenobacter sp.]
MAIDGLRIRFFTSVVFVLIMLAGIMAGKYTFILLFGLILAFCLWEFLAAGVEGHDPSQWWLRRFGLVFGLVPYLAATAFQLGWMNVHQLEMLALLLLPALFLVFLIELFQNGPHPFRYIGNVFTGLLYIGMPFVLLSLAAFQPAGSYRMDVVLGLVLLTWTNDTGAYLVGSRLGKTPFFPRISPKKTWEGLLGRDYYAWELLLCWGLCCRGLRPAIGWYCRCWFSSSAPWVIWWSPCSSAAGRSKIPATCCPATAAYSTVSTGLFFTCHLQRGMCCCGCG